jgi:hypothetical protein
MRADIRTESSGHQLIYFVILNVHSSVFASLPVHMCVPPFLLFGYRILQPVELCVGCSFRVFVEVISPKHVT